MPHTATHPRIYTPEEDAFLQRLQQAGYITAYLLDRDELRLARRLVREGIVYTALTDYGRPRICYALDRPYHSTDAAPPAD